MSYTGFRALLLRLLRAPDEPPDPPAGSRGSARVFRASPRYLTYRMCAVGLVAGILTAVWLAMGVAILIDGEPLALLALLPMGALFLAIAGLVAVGVRIDYDMRYYVVTDRALRIREGAFVIREQTLTHANVQNLNIEQGPLQRLFGIRSLAVQTAGGGGGDPARGGASGHRFAMAGIENAEEVRELVLGYLKRGGAGAGLGDPDDLDGARGASPELDPRALAVLRELHQAARGLRRAVETKA